ncbi:MAG: bifunctional ornithine acetyltransferase/N-acetylglutamate synthase, partial [Pseudomonadota bacterium]
MATRPKKRAARKGARKERHTPFDPLADVLRQAFVRQRAPSGTSEAAGSTKPPRSPLAPERFPSMPAVGGVQLGVAATGERYKGRPDLLVAELSTGTSVAGVFTQSTLPAACVTWNKANLTTGKAPPRARALVVNAGNANAFTGKQGMDTVKAVAQDTYRLLGGRRRDVFVASTGVIGEPLLPGALTPFLPKAIKAAKPKAWEDAARAIMTTDTFPKGAVATAEIDGQPVTIAGIAKGSGMISPNMATLLGFIFTDASIPSPVLQTLLLIANRESFNAITVDSDTSTNDMVLLFATGQGAQHRPVTRAGDRRLA